MRSSIALLLLAGCGGAAAVTPHRPLGAAEHRAEANEHDARAAEHAASAASAAEHADDTEGYVCGDTVLADQATSGGERLAFPAPCWNGHVVASFEHRRAAAHERSEAARHRARARELERVERDRCAGMTTDELDHTPLWHREDIARVERLVEGATLRGARVVFRPVTGLGVPWMEHALECHRARAAVLGWDSRYMGYDPSLVAGATTTVVAGEPGIVVEIRALDPDVAAVVAGRAEALVTEAVTPGRP